MKKQLIIFSFLVSTLLFVFGAQIQAVEPTNLTQIFSKIEKYNYGQNRESLMQLKELINSSLENPAELKAIEQEMIALLKSDASFAAKQFICEQLSLIGSEDALPVLADLLNDKKTADIALFALERIHGQKVNETLRSALKKAKGKIQIGIINTLGQRFDAEAVEALSKILLSSNTAAAEASADALGKIADENAAKVLSKAIDKTNGAVQLAVFKAYLRCGDLLSYWHLDEKANSIYAQILAKDAPQAICLTALKGKIQTSKQPQQVILEVLKNDSPEMQTVAIELVRELPPALDMRGIAEFLPNLAPTAKVQLITALEARGDISVREPVVQVADDSSTVVRIAVLKALAKLGNENDVALLAEFATSGTPTEKEAARQSLARLKGGLINDTILYGITEPENPTKRELIKAVAARQIINSEEVLLSAMQNPDRGIRIEAMKALAEVASPDYLPQLFEFLISVKSDADRNALMNTVVSVSRRCEDDTIPTEQVLTQLGNAASVEAKASLLKIAGRLGTEQMMPILMKNLQDTNSEIKLAAIEGLSNWPTSEPLDRLLKINETDKDEIVKIMALRGFINLIEKTPNQPEKKLISLYEIALKHATEVNEKRLVLAGLSNMQSLLALEMASKLTAEQEIRQEAASAVVKISKKTGGIDSKKTKQILRSLLQLDLNDAIRSEAEALQDWIK